MQSMQWIWFTKNSRLSSNKSVLSVLMAHPSLTLPKFSRHQLIQLRISWKLVDERHKGAADFQKPLPVAQQTQRPPAKAGGLMRPKGHR